jgi:hypothetical protein
MAIEDLVEASGTTEDFVHGNVKFPHLAEKPSVDGGPAHCAAEKGAIAAFGKAKPRGYPVNPIEEPLPHFPGALMASWFFFLFAPLAWMSSGVSFIDEEVFLGVRNGVRTVRTYATPSLSKFMMYLDPRSCAMLARTSVYLSRVVQRQHPSMAPYGTWDGRGSCGYCGKWITPLFACANNMFAWVVGHLENSLPAEKAYGKLIFLYTTGASEFTGHTPEDYDMCDTFRRFTNDSREYTFCGVECFTRSMILAESQGPTTHNECVLTCDRKKYWWAHQTLGDFTDIPCAVTWSHEDIDASSAYDNMTSIVNDLWHSPVVQVMVGRMLMMSLHCRREAGMMILDPYGLYITTIDTAVRAWIFSETPACVCVPETDSDCTLGDSDTLTEPYDAMDFLAVAGDVAPIWVEGVLQAPYDTMFGDI